MNDVGAQIYGPADPFAFLRNPTVHEFIEAAALAHNLPVRAIIGECRARDYVRPRQAAMYLSYRQTGLSRPQIGRAFRRDPTTILHAGREIERLLRINPDVAESVLSINRIAHDLAAERFGEIRPRLAAYR